ncbi:MAG: TolC family protein [Ferruginibacter sp.]
MNRFIILLLTIVTANGVHAQDSTKSLSLSQVIEMVTSNHPVARQADILVEKSKADVTIARGMFDPVLKNEAAQKTFDGINYYNYNRPELLVPTWFGIEVTTGLEYLSGNQTNPEETKGETSYLGISVPLAKNLLMDKRRAALRSAKLYRTASETEKRSILNNLMLDVTKAYWNWVQQYQVYTILTDAVEVNRKRTRLVTMAFTLGDRPAIDTVEALSQLQYFELQQSQAQLEFKNSGLELAVHLWSTNMNPVLLAEDMIPADGALLQNTATENLPDLGQLLEAARKNHPEINLYNFKLNILNVDKKLKFQELLPDVRFRYNQLGRGYNLLKTASGPLFENNFQYGITVGIPLRFSAGRGEYRKAKLKISETELQQKQKMLQVENKVKSYFNELLALQYQVNLQERAYNNYYALQRGEEIRFRSGESSLFLINSRETKALEALQKLQELKVKYYKTAATLKWAAGLLAP